MKSDDPKTERYINSMIADSMNTFSPIKVTVSDAEFFFIAQRTLSCCTIKNASRPGQL